MSNQQRNSTIVIGASSFCNLIAIIRHVQHPIAVFRKWRDQSDAIEPFANSPSIPGR